MTTEEHVRLLETALVELCAKHDAVLFPRKDSKRTYISAEVGKNDQRIWLDYVRISGDGAERAPILMKSES